MEQTGHLLTLKEQSPLQQTTFRDSFHCFSEKIRLDVSNESSARQKIHMKNQALFSSKDKSKKGFKCCLLYYYFITFYYFGRHYHSSHAIHDTISNLTEATYILFNPFTLRKAKIVYNFGLSECNRVKVNRYTSIYFQPFYKEKQLS